MADDAAGAVRRTPHPGPTPPAAWWSPTEGFWSTNDGPVEGLRLLDTADEFRAYPPPDAVELVGPDQRRPVVLLPAAGCACTPPYADCPHGPEPVDALDLAVWLHAEARWRGEQTQRELARLYRHHHEIVELAATERDAILPRLAELTEAAGKKRSTEWLRTCATLPMEEWPPAPAYKGPTVPAAERDALQARLDEIRTVLAEDAETRARFQVDTSTSYGPRFLSRIREIVERDPAALQGDQPAEGPRWWGTEDGGIAAVMCGDCHTLGGHDDDCPRRQPTGEVDRG